MNKVFSLLIIIAIAVGGSIPRVSVARHGGPDQRLGHACAPCVSWVPCCRAPPTLEVSVADKMLRCQ